MASEVAFNASKGAFSIYGALLRDVAQEMGMEKAVALHAKQGEAFGTMTAGMIADELGDAEFNMQAVASVLANASEGFGLIADVEATADTATMEVSKCPIYEGCKMAGWSHEEIETLCSHLSAVEAAEITKKFPHLSASVTFRSAPDTPCVEEFRWEH